MKIAENKARIVRVLTYHKGLEAIEQETVDAINDGNQVLVNAACASDHIEHKPDGDKAAAAAWAAALSEQHGLGWRRVGLDVLFARPAV